MIQHDNITYRTEVPVLKHFMVPIGSLGKLREDYIFSFQTF